MLLLGIITSYNNLAEMYLIQACFFATLVVLLLAFRSSVRTPLLQSASRTVQSTRTLEKGLFLRA